MSNSALAMALLGILALVHVSGTWSGGAGSAGGKSGQEAIFSRGLAMSVEIEILAPKKPFLVGSAMPVTAFLRNLGSSPIDLPSPGAQSPFEYTVLSGDGKKALFSFSERGRDLALQRGIFPPSHTPTQAVNPGQGLTFNEDLAGFLTQPIPPGRYLIQAGLMFQGKTVHSNQAPFEVVPLQVTALAQVLNFDRRKMVTAVSHREPDGSETIFRRQSTSGHPEVGTFQELHRLPPSREVESIALALETAPVPGWRWLLWLEKGELAGGMSREFDIKYPIAPAPTGLDSPRLLEHGYQFESGTALFILSGSEGNGRKIKLISVPGLRPPELMNVPLSASIPEQIFASLLRADGSQRLLLTWIEADGSTSRMVGVRVDPDDLSKTGKIEVLFQTDRPILAGRLEPLTLEPPIRAEFLLAPDEKGGLAYLAKLELYDNGARTITNLPVSRTPRDKAVNQWILPSHEDPSAPLLALIGDRLYSSRTASQEPWRLVAGQLGEANHIRLVSFQGEELWATWWTPQAGFLTRALP